LRDAGAGGVPASRIRLVASATLCDKGEMNNQGQRLTEQESRFDGFRHPTRNYPNNSLSTLPEYAEQSLGTAAW